jgi:hypothetical protein
MSSIGGLGSFFKQPDALPGRAPPPPKKKLYIFEVLLIHFDFLLIKKKLGSSASPG